MATLTELLGDRLLEHTTTDGVQVNSYMATSKLNGKTIGLYFSGHWCPPSRDFTPQLVQAYNNAYNEVKHKFDIVFISSDRDQQSFDHYYQEMPWKALPFADRTRQQALYFNRYQVRGIPCLIVLSPSGEIIARDGVEEIYKNGAGSIRQWAQASSLEEIVPITFADVDVQTDPAVPVKPVLVSDDDDEIPPTTRNRRLTKKRGYQLYFLIMSIGCMAIILLALLIAFILLKSSPRLRKTITTVGKKEGTDKQEITLKAMFSTNYYLESKDQSETIISIDDLTDQLNTKLTANKIRVLKALFLSNSISKKYRKILCKNPLFGNILQLHIIASFSGQCDYEDYMCKFILKEQLQNNLTQIVNNTITINFVDDRIANTNIKLCSLTEIIEEEEEEEEESEETATTNLKGLAGKGLPLSTNDSLCSISSAKITFVHLSGQQGTEIRDETSKTDPIDANENIQSITVTLYESSVNVLHIQLDCNQQYDDDSIDYSCSLAYHIHVLIDLNDDGKFDEAENRVHQRSLIHSKKSKGTYNLEVSIPPIDGINTKAGSHRMHLNLIPSEDYRKKCGKTGYKETREYKVKIISKPVCNAGITQTVIINNFICSSSVGKIKTVLMGGELNTQIRDERLTNALSNEYEKQQQHTITLFGDAVYLLRVQFDCPRQQGSNLFETDCTPAHHVDVWIDLNNDGKFDASENRVYRRSRLDDETPEYTYDLQLLIPPIDAINTNAGTHKMRIKLIRSEPYQKKCGKNELSETREYTVNIIQRKKCPNLEREYAYEPEPDAIVQLSADFTSRAHCSPGNLICSVGNSAIFSVKLSGEENTMINDEITRCSSINNYEDRSQIVVKLFDNTINILQIQLHCVKPWNFENLDQTNCNVDHYVGVWIDLNDDGNFDEIKERFFDNDQINRGFNKRFYDFNIFISEIERENYIDGPHRMRIILTREKDNLKPCFNAGYGEARDYTIHITRKPYY